jgi:glycerol uptake facilitator-like aquaporin
VRRYTPFVIPLLYAIMVPLEAHISGTSTNPARTFRPAPISGRWDGWWINWVRTPPVSSDGRRPLGAGADERSPY